MYEGACQHDSLWNTLRRSCEAVVAIRTCIVRRRFDHVDPAAYMRKDDVPHALTLTKINLEIWRTIPEQLQAPYKPYTHARTHAQTL